MADANLAYRQEVASWDDVRRIALGLPETSERPSYDGVAAWRVKDKPFVWERPLRGKELHDLGPAAPDGPILGVRVADLGVKEALLADDPGLFFTTPHFDGYPSVLVRLDRIGVTELTELIVEAWYARAPRRLAAAHQAQTAPPEAGG
ncbi:MULTISPECIES: MmcQ/YjbR family DNA-binding protein [unclassified Micromonospora]|uniref:MmcQ/YjbR family DNA-binding protein n=1 Tax=unclassified Micromonospora TaxID=2617518 RepID=UPI0022B5FAC7|nr:MULTISPECIES: MmcQ/YjbR family DNA-binding protein [unclassified Micromonospora]MCZ7422332.1 MmcQ/YjbR family DNA-binding protein [Verrucosispora sp. WMMA2121]WBB90086.1 MmcQ/YjbR family DNA-binding protein [Verrucosispora sp. WMMC514]